MLSCKEFLFSVGTGCLYFSYVESDTIIFEAWMFCGDSSVCSMVQVLQRKLILPLVCYAPELFKVTLSKVIFICVHSWVHQIRVKVMCYSLPIFIFDQSNCKFWHINGGSQIYVKQIKLAAFTVTRSDKIFLGDHQVQFGTEINNFGDCFVCG
jgi:hypothetical protein